MDLELGVTVKNENKKQLPGLWGGIRISALTILD